MRDGKLRIAPTCYHTLHIVPIMAAHEMNFLTDEGLKTADGSLGYEILRDPMVPFGLEKLGISQGMKERSVSSARAALTSILSPAGETRSRAFLSARPTSNPCRM